MHGDGHQVGVVYRRGTFSEDFPFLSDALFSFICLANVLCLDFLMEPFTFAM